MLNILFFFTTLMKAICFDIEATDREEILELSIYDYKSGEEIFHNYFKPRRERSWPNSEAVHHITPQMVADKPYFSQYKREIQSLINSADLLIGFAIDNDINYLRIAGIHIPDSKPIAETKQWYWACRGKADGVLLDAVPKLTVCANNMGIEFPVDDAHSASADTRNTLLLFKTLHEEYCASRGIEKHLDDRSLSVFNKEYAEECLNYARENAKGFITLIPKENGYYIKNSHKPQEKGISIFVNSRFIAEADIRKMFAKREDRNRQYLYRLRESDIEQFKSYTNTFDSVKEKLCKKLYTQGRSNRPTLTFHLD